MIYLDNAATTRPSEGVKRAVIEAMERFGNPSSMHRLGIEAEKIIKNSAESAARVLGTEDSNIYFTSGGTEANNTAILGYCRRNKNRGRHLITTAIEHPSAAEPFKKLEQEGFEVTVIGAVKDGVINLDVFEGDIKSDTIFVSCMWVNNETGNIEPVCSLKNIMKKHSPKAVLYVDGVQSFGKIECRPEKYGIDMMSVSSHKIHGIKGCGALYINNLHIDPLMIGGGQQKNIRSGTENVVGIAAFGEACRELEIEKDYEYVAGLKNKLQKEITENIENVKINGEGETSAYILNVSFLGIKAEILLHALEARGIYVSSGSACSSNKPMPSRVLTAMGCTKEEISGALRFSFSRDITLEDIEYTATALKTEVENIRKYMR